jgi:hypothetical protein
MHSLFTDSCLTEVPAAAYAWPCTFTHSIIFTGADHEQQFSN